MPTFSLSKTDVHLNQALSQGSFYSQMWLTHSHMPYAYVNRYPFQWISFNLVKPYVIPVVT